MIQRILQARHFFACLLAAGTGMALYFRAPFPESNLFVQVMALRAHYAFLFFKYSYTLFLYTTPYILFSVLLSGVYIFALKAGSKIRAGRLPPYAEPRKRTELSLVLGEVHHPRKQIPSETPHWLVFPERGLFTVIAIVGAVGSGKTASAMYPFAEQILAYRADDPDRRIGGLILEVKGDFCARVREILTRHGRAGDYVEISLRSEYRYNPLHNDLDAYALAYNISSLLNNLFGRGKEPFWQQAYTNLVKFIILLHKVAFDYVTLFDVYECAINPDLLESRITEAQRRLIEADSALLWEEEYLKYPRDLDPFHFRLDKESNRFRAPLTPGLLAVLKEKHVQWEAENASREDPIHHRSKAVRMAQPSGRTKEGEKQRNHSGDCAVETFSRPASSFVGESFPRIYFPKFSGEPVESRPARDGSTSTRSRSGEDSLAWLARVSPWPRYESSSAWSFR